MTAHGIIKTAFGLMYEDSEIDKTRKQHKVVTNE